jgi:hypothetical protein
VRVYGGECEQHAEFHVRATEKIERVHICCWGRAGVHVSSLQPRFVFSVFPGAANPKDGDLLSRLRRNFMRVCGLLTGWSYSRCRRTSSTRPQSHKHTQSLNTKHHTRTRPQAINPNASHCATSAFLPTLTLSSSSLSSRIPAPFPKSQS